MTEPLPPPAVIGYAKASPEDQTTPTALRRLAWLNLACGSLILAEFPAIFGLFVVVAWVRASRGGRLPQSLGDMARTAVGQWRNGAAAVGFAVACGLAAVASAWLIDRRRWRWFSVVAGFALCFSVPFGIVAGLPTAIVLMRRRSRAAYAAGRHPGAR